MKEPQRVSRSQLEARTGRFPGRFWLYFEHASKDDSLIVDTSWLPALPEVRQVLGLLGFRRLQNGSYRAILRDLNGHLRILRTVTKALSALLDEVSLLKCDETMHVGFDNGKRYKVTRTE